MPAVSVRHSQPYHPLSALWARFQRWQDQVREPALTVLLVIQLTFLFIVGPLVNINVLPHCLLDSVQVVMPMVSFFALQRNNKVRLFILLTNAPMVWILFAGSNIYIGLLLRTLVTLAVTVAVAQAVFQARKVTRHQLLGAVVVYLNIALLFVGAFAGVKYLFPNAFITLSKAPLQSGELVYFSLTTITSTGYGDILPVHPLARSLANLEAVSGQLFLGVFLARLVSLHGSLQGFKRSVGF
jgi:hypothetical protein